MGLGISKEKRPGILDLPNDIHEHAIKIEQRTGNQKKKSTSWQRGAEVMGVVDVGEKSLREFKDHSLLLSTMRSSVSVAAWGGGGGGGHGTRGEEVSRGGRAGETLLQTFTPTTREISQLVPEFDIFLDEEGVFGDGGEEEEGEKEGDGGEGGGSSEYTHCQTAGNEGYWHALNPALTHANNEGQWQGISNKDELVSKQEQADPREEEERWGGSGHETSRSGGAGSIGSVFEEAGRMAASVRQLAQERDELRETCGVLREREADLEIRRSQQCLQLEQALERVCVLSDRCKVD